MYKVYGLLGLENEIFYVGFTKNLHQRLLSHSSGSSGCRSYKGVRKVKEAGWRFGYVVFGEFDDSVEAKRLERMLIGHLPNLVNSTAPQAMLSDFSYPITEYDEKLLEAGLKAVGLGVYGGYFIKSDTSPEFVDERYDDLEYEALDWN